MSFEGYAVAGIIGVWNTTMLPDHTGMGKWLFGVVGEAVSAGEALCVKADEKWYLADADARVTMPAEGLAMENKGIGQTCKILLSGIFRDDSWAWTAGLRLYASSVAGAMIQTVPIGKYPQYQSLGEALTAKVILFTPLAQEHKEAPFCGGCGEGLLDVGYSSINGVQPVTDNPDKSYICVPYAGTLRDLRVRLSTVPGAGTSWTFTVYRAWADTALATTIANLEADNEDNVNEVAILVDDRICMHITKSGAPAPTFAAWSAHLYRT